MTGQSDSASALMLEAIIERTFGDKVQRTKDGVLRTYYSGFDLSELARTIANEVNKALRAEAKELAAPLSPSRPRDNGATE